MYVHVCIQALIWGVKGQSAEVCSTRWMLGIKLKIQGLGENAFNHQAISPALVNLLPNQVKWKQVTLVCILALYSTNPRKNTSIILTPGRFIRMFAWLKYGFSRNQLHTVSNILGSLHKHTYVEQVHTWYSWMSEEGVRFSETGVIDGCGPPCGC